MAYDWLKFLHVLGVIMLIGNVTITAFWKVFADRTGDPKLIAHAQYGVTVTEWMFTLSGIALIVIGGYGMALDKGLDLTESWLASAQIAFLISGLMWLFVLVPLQIRQAKVARTLQPGVPLPADYVRDCKRWLWWGIAATVPLVFATYVMVVKPG